MAQFVEQTLGTLLSKLGIHLKDYELPSYPAALKICTSLMRQPRDVIRLANRLIFSIPAIQGEINICDVLVFEAMSLRFPMLRERIHRHPSDYVGAPFEVDAVGFTDMDWMVWADNRLGAGASSDEPIWERDLPVELSEQSKVKRALVYLFGNEDSNVGDPVDQLRIKGAYRLARYFRITSFDSVPEVTTIHTMLRDPQKLKEVLTSGTESEMTSFLEWVYAYAPSCSAIDGAKSLDVLTSISKQAASGSDWSAERARMFSNVIGQVLRYSVTDERGPLLLWLIDSAPLSVSVSVVLDAVAEQGKWSVGPAKEKPVDQQLVPNFSVDVAVEKWTLKVRAAIEEGKLVAEPRMHEILYRLGEFNWSFGEVFSAVREICSTDDGLEEFLSVYVKDSPLHDTHAFGLIDDPERLVIRINESRVREKYQWLVDLISSPDIMKSIIDQAAVRRALNNFVKKSPP